MLKYAAAFEFFLCMTGLSPCQTVHWPGISRPGDSLNPCEYQRIVIV